MITRTVQGITEALSERTHLGEFCGAHRVQRGGNTDGRKPALIALQIHVVVRCGDNTHSLALLRAAFDY